MAITVKQFTSAVLAEYGTFSAWITALGVGNNSIEIGTDTEIVGTVVVPANIDIKGFLCGAKFTGSGTLTINKMSADPQHQIFANTLTVSLAQNWDRPEWFGGGSGSYITNETIAMQQAVDSLTDQGVVKGLPKAYSFVGLNLRNKPRKFIGDNGSGTIFNLVSNTNHLIIIDNPSEKIGYEFENINFQYPYGNPATPSSYDAISCTRIALSRFTKCHFGGFRRGIDFLLDCNTTEVLSCVFGSSNTVGLQFTSPGTTTLIRVVGCFFDENLSRGVNCNSSAIEFVGNTFQDNSGTHLYLDTSAQNNLITGNKFNVGGGAVETNIAIDCYGDRNTIVGNKFEQHSEAYDVYLQTGAQYNTVMANACDRIDFVSNADATNTVIKSRSARHVFSGSDDGVNQIQAKSLHIIDNTASTTKDTGAIICEGGAGIEGTVTAGISVVAPLGNFDDTLIYAFTSSDSDITGLVTEPSGSTMGTLIEGRTSGHIVLGIRDNDNLDSVSIVSGNGNYNGDTTYDKLCFKVRANGTIRAPSSFDYVYLYGDESTDGSLRMYATSTQRLTQKRVSGNWTTIESMDY